ncbi:MAG: UDP-3-O-(3-hydroxymyristoyl)glucosamine N-acyltransferase [Pyrinomonadaceae bacterium]
MKTSEIAELIGGALCGDGTIEINSCAAIDQAAEGQIAFTESTESRVWGNASCLLVPNGSAASSNACVIVVEHPKLAFARVAAKLHPRQQHAPHTHPTAIVASTAAIGENVFLGAFACVGEGSTIGNGSQLMAGARIGDGVSIGKECVVHANVVVKNDCSIGDRVVLHSGVVIGADGFGYVRDGSAGYVQFPQIGTVVIENDVEIGANTCVDRGALGETRIGEGTKIDNLVQVGHNVNIGKRCVIAAQTGISGSVVIEDDCVIGGQVGFGDHVRVQSGAVIGSQAGILPGKIVRPGIWWGTPIQPLDEYKRQNAHLKSIGRLKAEVKALKENIRNDRGE